MRAPARHSSWSFVCGFFCLCLRVNQSPEQSSLVSTNLLTLLRGHKEVASASVVNPSSLGKKSNKKSSFTSQNHLDKGPQGSMDNTGKLQIVETRNSSFNSFPDPFDSCSNSLLTTGQQHGADNRGDRRGGRLRERCHCTSRRETQSEIFGLIEVFIDICRGPQYGEVLWAEDAEGGPGSLEAGHLLLPSKGH